jgi:hypothetical protein
MSKSRHERRIDETFARRRRLRDRLQRASDLVEGSPRDAFRSIDEAAFAYVGFMRSQQRRQRRTAMVSS